LILYAITGVIARFFRSLFPTYACKIPLRGFKSRLLKNFTTCPVSKAQITVPSRVPTIVQLKRNKDSTMAAVTQLTSKMIYMFPNWIPVVSDRALTKASPEFMMTLAIKASDTPKPRIVVPTSTMKICMG